MRRVVFLLAGVAVVLVAPFALAYPPAVLTSDEDSITVGALDCGTSYEIRVRERRSGSWRDQLTYTKATTACATPTPTSTPAATATPSPTATPTASPTPTATPTPSPAPVGDFPNEASTGVPDGVTLSTYSGPSTVQTPGTVIDGKSIGCIRVSVPGVIIRNSRITCSSGYAALYVEDGNFVGTPLLVEDSEIDCGNSTIHGIGEANITLRRVEVRLCQNGGDLNQAITIEDSLIHRLSNAGSDPHEDGVQLAWGHVENGQIVSGTRNITMRHNTIYGMNSAGGFGTSAIISNNAAASDENVLIENNLLAGGAYTLYCPADGPGVDYRVLDNHFSSQFSPKVGFLRDVDELLG